MTVAVERTYRRAGTYRVEFNKDGSVVCTRNGKPVGFHHMQAEALQRSL